jgi:prephenate dehydrogenase
MGRRRWPFGTHWRKKTAVYISAMLVPDQRVPADIGIIGAGRFGTYLAAQLQRIGCRVHLGDARDASAATDIARACAAPIAIYAVPIRNLERAILDTRDWLGPETVVMDVCSVKSIPCALLERHLPGRGVVGTHPLFGPQSAPVSCAGQRIALCAIPHGAAIDPLPTVERLCTRLGLTIVHCTPKEHDTQVARTQFLTHFIGRGAVRAGIDRLALSTKSHEALMDIIAVVCHDSMELFEDMATFNPMVPAVRAAFLDALHTIDEGLTKRESSGLR